MPITFKSKHTFVLGEAQFLDPKIRRKFLLCGPINRTPCCGMSSGLIVATMHAPANSVTPLCRPNITTREPQIGEVRMMQNRV